MVFKCVRIVLELRIWPFKGSKRLLPLLTGGHCLEVDSNVLNAEDGSGGSILSTVVMHSD